MQLNHYGIKVNSFEKIFLIIFIFLFCILNVYPNSKESKIGWEKLEKSWNNYIKSPSQENAFALYNELKKNIKYPSYFEDSDDYDKVTEIIKNDLYKFNIRVEKNNFLAIKIAFRLNFIVDIYSIYPVEIFGKLIKTNTKDLLKVIKSFIGEKSEGLINYIACYDIDTTGNVELEIIEAKERIKYLKKVVDKPLIEIRDNCIKLLEKKIKYYWDRGDIPTNLEECFIRLKEILKGSKLQEFKNKKEEDILEYHFGLGLWMRSNWGLWSGRTKLSKYFTNLGIFHPDNISSLILETFWCHLNKKDLELEKKIKSCVESEYFNRGPEGRSPIDNARIDWVFAIHAGRGRIWLGISTTDGTGWRYDTNFTEGIKPAERMENYSLNERRKRLGFKEIEVPNFETKKKLRMLAQKIVSEYKLIEFLNKSEYAIVCQYKKKEIKRYDTIGILNFQLTMITIVDVKGTIKAGTIFINIHSPGLSGFGHEENYGKYFLILLSKDKYEDSHYAEGIDFIKAIKLE